MSEKTDRLLRNEALEKALRNHAEELRLLQRRAEEQKRAELNDTCSCDNAPRCPCCGKKVSFDHLRDRWTYNYGPGL